MRFGEFVLDSSGRQFWRDGKPVRLTPKAFDLLDLLVNGRPRALSKGEIHQHLWPATHVSDSNLPVLVHELREALGDDAHEPHWVRTVPRFGYAFCGEAQPDGEDGPAWECRWDCRVLWGDREILLRAGENVLGRSRKAAVWVEDGSVSRRHALIRISDSGPTLEDCKSRNGTHIGEKRVNGPVPLEDKDGIRLGQVLLTFRAFARDDVTSAYSTTPIEPFSAPPRAKR